MRDLEFQISRVLITKVEPQDLGHPGYAVFDLA